MAEGPKDMTVPGILAPRWRAKLDAWARDKRGLAAVEFALLATPFFLLIFGLLEICVLFIITSLMENALNEAARQIRTGQMQAGQGGQAAFVAAVCGEMHAMMPDCMTALKIDSQVFSDFSSTSAAPTSSLLDSDGNLNSSSFGYAPGAQNEIVVVRIFYEWDLIVPGMTAPLANMSNNRRLLQATVAFRNEPFG